MQTLTTLRTHARTLAMASMLALAVVSLPTVQAHAEPRQGAGDYGYCINPGDGQVYFPGERVLSPEGQFMECQADGSWKPVNLLVVAPGNHLPAAPARISGAAIAP